MKKIKKHWKKIVTAIFIIILIVIIIKIGIAAYKNFYHDLLNNPAWLRENINIVKTEEGIYEIEKDKDISIFSENYQTIIEEKIEELKDCADYTLENPLLIHNPYGTNNLSYYLYYIDDNNSLNYKIETAGYSDFEREISNQDHNNEYQLIGFIVGEVNTLTLSDGEKEQKFKITTPKITTTADIDNKLKIIEGDSEEELTDGLYAVLGHDKNYASNIYLYDNEGILRGEFVLDNYRADRIVFNNDYMYYAYSEKGIIKVNNLGKIEKLYDLENYTMHHDMVYDEDNNCFVILVNEDDTDTIEDVIITVDLNDGKIEKIIDMKDLLPEFYLNAVKPEGKNTYGGYELDWIHLNSLSLIGDDIVLSSRELSTIIYINNAYTNPTVKYLLTDESVTENTSYANLLYKKMATLYLKLDNIASLIIKMRLLKMENITYIFEFR